LRKFVLFKTCFQIPVDWKIDRELVKDLVRAFFMRQVFKKVRKMLGRDLTPQKIAARVPRVFWVNALGEWLLGQKAAVPQRQRMLLTLRAAVRVGCPF
jgi:hypothetical protein